MPSIGQQPARVEVCILAGGLSSRMGRDKALLRLGGKTLLSHVKSAAAALKCPVRVVRRDLIPRCGPLGGVYTALKTTEANRILFLSCDMPFIPASLLERMTPARSLKSRAVFVRHDERLGFPFLLPAESLAEVEDALRERRLALQELAMRLNARVIRPTRREAALLLNVNTPADLRRGQKLWTSFPSQKFFLA